MAQHELWLEVPQRVALIKLLQMNTDAAVDTYLVLTDQEVREAWIKSELDIY
jgi:uncharacterized protein